MQRRASRNRRPLTIGLITACDDRKVIDVRRENPSTTPIHHRHCRPGDGPRRRDGAARQRGALVAGLVCRQSDAVRLQDSAPDRAWAVQARRPYHPRHPHRCRSAAAGATVSAGLTCTWYNRSTHIAAYSDMALNYNFSWWNGSGSCSGALRRAVGCHSRARSHLRAGPRRPEHHYAATMTTTMPSCDTSKRTSPPVTRADLRPHTVITDRRPPLGVPRGLLVYGGCVTAAVREALAQLLAYRYFLYQSAVLPGLSAAFSEDSGSDNRGLLQPVGIASGWREGEGWNGCSEAWAAGLVPELTPTYEQRGLH
jgi:hypothetical protein